MQEGLRARLDGGPADPDPVLAAVADTIIRYRIAPQHFWVFLDAMRMDVPGTALFRARYRTMAELRDYMRGSAAAIGLQLLPVLGTVVPVPEAEPAAAALGEAFQLTNFLRDVGEDLDRGRIYLPTTELATFGVDEELLRHCHRTGRVAPRLRRALAHLIAVNRDLYRTAQPGIDLLQPRVRPGIRTAAVLYAGILDEVERQDYEIFARRAVVPRRRRLGVAATEFASAAILVLRNLTGTTTVCGAGRRSHRRSAGRGTTPTATVCGAGRRSDGVAGARNECPTRGRPVRPPGPSDPPERSGVRPAIPTARGPARRSDAWRVRAANPPKRSGGQNYSLRRDRRRPCGSPRARAGRAGHRSDARAATRPRGRSTAGSRRCCISRRASQ